MPKCYYSPKLRKRIDQPRNVDLAFHCTYRYQLDVLDSLATLPTDVLSLSMLALQWKCSEDIRLKKNKYINLKEYSITF